MEKKNKTEYNTEYQRNKRGSVRRQERGSVLENGERLTIIIPKENKDYLKQIALSKEIGVNQLLRELIEDFIDKSK